MPALAKLSDALFSNPIGAVEDGSLTALSSLAHPRFNVGEVRRGGDYENAEEDALLADLAAARGVDMQELKEKRAEEAETEGGDLPRRHCLPKTSWSYPSDEAPPPRPRTTQPDGPHAAGGCEISSCRACG